MPETENSDIRDKRICYNLASLLNDIKEIANETNLCELDRQEHNLSHKFISIFGGHDYKDKTAMFHTLKFMFYIVRNG